MKCCGNNQLLCFKIELFFIRSKEVWIETEISFKSLNKLGLNNAYG